MPRTCLHEQLHQNSFYTRNLFTTGPFCTANLFHQKTPKGITQNCHSHQITCCSKPESFDAYLIKQTSILEKPWKGWARITYWRAEENNDQNNFTEVIHGSQGEDKMIQWGRNEGNVSFPDRAASSRYDGTSAQELMVWKLKTKVLQEGVRAWRFKPFQNTMDWITWGRK